MYPSVIVVNVLQPGLLLLAETLPQGRRANRLKMSASNIMFLFSVLPQLQPTPTQAPVLSLKTDEHHISKRDVHKNQPAPTNLVRC